MYMKNSPRMINYGIALALFGILIFSLFMKTMEGMSTKKSKEPMKSKTDKEESINKETDKTMLTKEEADKLVKKLMELNTKQKKS